MSVALKSVQWQETYPMDFYANESLGAWTVNNEKHRPVKPKTQRVKKTKLVPAEMSCACKTSDNTCSTDRCCQVTKTDNSGIK